MRVTEEEAIAITLRVKRNKTEAKMLAASPELFNLRRFLYLIWLCASDAARVIGWPKTIWYLASGVMPKGKSDRNG
jgi:hypothetical protein